MIEDGTINWLMVSLLVSLYLFVGFLCALGWWFVGNGRKEYKKALNEAEEARGYIKRLSPFSAQIYQCTIKHYENKAEGIIGYFMLIWLFWSIGSLITIIIFIVSVPMRLYDGMIWILKRTIGR